MLQNMINMYSGVSNAVNEATLNLGVKLQTMLPDTLATVGVDDNIMPEGLQDLYNGAVALTLGLTVAIGITMIYDKITDNNQKGE